jgi:Skp family chaperone for outer membrane proteins
MSKIRIAPLALATLLLSAPAIPAFASAAPQTQAPPQTQTDAHGVPVQSSDQMKADQQDLKQESKQSKKQAKADKKAAKEKKKAAKNAEKAEQHQDKADSQLQKANTPQ